MLSFVDALKRMIADIEATGGAVIERTFPSHQLLQQLREYAIQGSRKSTSGYYVGDWFFEGYFEEHVRACVVYLHKHGTSDDDRVYHLLTKVIDKMVKGHAGIWEEQDSFESQLVRSLEIVWYECGDEQTYLYTTAESRWLITWDYQKSRWKATGLGRLFMDLAPLEATIFLLSIDALFATGEYDFHHISSDVLRRLQSLKPDDESQVIERLNDHHHTLLMRLGIFSQVKPGVDLERSSTDLNGNVQVTPIGQTVLNAILSEKNFYRDAALSIVRTEEVGGPFSELASKIIEMDRLGTLSDLVDQVKREPKAISSNKDEVNQHKSSRNFPTKETSRKKSTEDTKETLPIKIFYCYAHEDKDLRDRIDKHLGVLKRLGQVVGWHDREIQAGTEWEREIEGNLNTAHIILLLVSADFVTSDYCYGVEMKKALELHRTGQARVLPIILRPVDWQDAPFAPLQMLPTGAKPITQWKDQDEALEDIAKGIRNVVSSLRAQKR